MKEVGTNKSWISPNTNATNESGFSALPGGNLNTDGKFNQVGNYGYWSTATQSNSEAAFFRSLVYVNGKLTGATALIGTGSRFVELGISLFKNFVTYLSLSTNI